MNRKSENRKAEIRRMIKAIKREHSNEYIESESQKIQELLLEQEKYKNSDELFCYVSYNKEVSTMKIINTALEDNKKIAVPKVIEKGMMEFYYINSMNQLREGTYGILEPGPECIKAIPYYKSSILFIVPGLAFDREGRRLGYGGGFYDRYLNKHSNYIKNIIAMAFQFQIIEKIPAEEYDFKINEIITNTEIIK